MINQSQINSFINFLHKSNSKQTDSTCLSPNYQNLMKNFNFLKRRIRLQPISHEQKGQNSLQQVISHEIYRQNKSFRLKQRKYDFKEKKNVFETYRENLNLKKEFLQNLIQNEQKQLRRCHFVGNSKQNRLKKYLNFGLPYENQQTKPKSSLSRPAFINNVNTVHKRRLILSSQRQSIKLKLQNTPTRQNQWPSVNKCKSIKLNKISLKPFFKSIKIKTQPVQNVDFETKQIRFGSQIYKKQSITLRRAQIKSQLTPHNNKNNNEKFVHSISANKPATKLQTTLQLNGWDYEQSEEYEEYHKNEE